MTYLLLADSIQERHNNELSSPSPSKIEIPEPTPPRRLAAAEGLRDVLQAEKRASNNMPLIKPEETVTLTKSGRYSGIRSEDVMKARREGKLLLSFLDRQSKTDEQSKIYEICFNLAI